MNVPKLRLLPLTGTGVARRTLAISATALSLCIVLISGYGWIAYRTVEHDTPVINAIPAASSTTTAAPKGTDGKDENILLVGNDDRTGATPAELRALSTEADGGAANTDTMIVLHVPADGSQATGISFPRDSWVAIPGHGMNKLNSAFGYGAATGGASGGAQLLIKTIQNLSGLHIDHYVSVSLLGFYRIANALGPIQVCLKAATYDKDSGTNLPKGVSTLNASQALSFVRQRENLPRGDLDREVRQQYFLSTELRKILSAGTLLNPLALNRVLKAVSSSIVKDKSLNLAQFAAQVQGLSAGRVTFATIPIVNADGREYSAEYGEYLSVVSVSVPAVRAFAAKATSARPTAATSSSPGAKKSTSSAATAAGTRAFTAGECID